MKNLNIGLLMLVHIVEREKKRGERKAKGERERRWKFKLIFSKTLKSFENVLNW